IICLYGHPFPTKYASPEAFALAEPIMARNCSLPSGIVGVIVSARVMAMQNTLATNPLREGISTQQVPEPCALVIFGATGDLTHRKLVPALYNLAADGDLPPGLSMVGFARRDKSDEIFRSELETAAKKYSRQAINDDLWKNFSSTIYYHRSEFGDSEGYRRLGERLDQLDSDCRTRGNRLFYLSSGPDQFENILTNLKSSGLTAAPNGGWARVIVEKPFGTDLESARH